MIIVAIIWSLTPVLDKICLKVAQLIFMVLFNLFGMFLFLIFLFIKNNLNQIESIKINWPIIFIAVFIGVVATIFQFLRYIG